MGACGSKTPPPRAGASTLKRPEMKEIAALPMCPVGDEIVGLHAVHGGPANGCQILLYIARALNTHAVGDCLKLKYLKSEEGEVMEDAVRIVEHCGYSIDGNIFRKNLDCFYEIDIVKQHIAAVAGTEELETSPVEGSVTVY